MKDRLLRGEAQYLYTPDCRHLVRGLDGYDINVNCIVEDIVYEPRFEDYVFKK